MIKCWLQWIGLVVNILSWKTSWFCKPLNFSGLPAWVWILPLNNAGMISKGFSFQPNWENPCWHNQGENTEQILWVVWPRNMDFIWFYCELFFLGGGRMGNGKCGTTERIPGSVVKRCEASNGKAVEWDVVRLGFKIYTSLFGAEAIILKNTTCPSWVNPLLLEY